MFTRNSHYFMPEIETFYYLAQQCIYTHISVHWHSSPRVWQLLQTRLILKYIWNIYFLNSPFFSSCTRVVIKTPGEWVFLWSSGRTPSILHFIVCLSPAVSLQQCHSSLRCISSLQLCLVTGMKLGLLATVICWRKLQAIRSWTLRTSRLRSPPLPLRAN